MLRTTLALCLITLAPLGALAQQTAQQKPSGETIAATVEETVRLIKENYVFAEKADAIVARIRERHAAGRYDAADAATVAARLTEDMQAATNDKHMSVAFDPPRAAAIIAAQSAAKPPAGGNDFFTQLMRTSNYGVPELRVLPGNVRYLALEPAFLWDPKRSPAVYDMAMRFLGAGDAYILDLRKNGGGSPDAVRYVISHFMEPDTKLITYRMGPQGTSESRTQKVERLPAKPLYVLTSPGSASASEEFAAHIKHFKLGTLVGAKTAGAGNRNSLYGTKEGFVVSVSVGTAIHAASNSGWEGTGIAPDMAVAPPVALDAAHLDALKKIRATATAKNPELDDAITRLSAKVNPIRLTEADMRAYVGAYGSQRKVTMRDGRLFWHFGPQEWELLPLGSDRFALVTGPNLTLQFNRADEKIAGVTEIFPSGQQESIARSAS
jgi:hypothetical protein